MIEKEMAWDFEHGSSPEKRQTRGPERRKWIAEEKHMYRASISIMKSRMLIIVVQTILNKEKSLKDKQRTTEGIHNILNNVSD